MNPVSARNLCLFARILDLILSTFSTDISSTKWGSDSDFVNNLDNAVVMWKMNVSLVNCGVLCNQNPSCWSFFYHSNMRMCLASMSFKRGLPPGEEIQQGWKYYTKPRQCDGDYVYYQPLGLCYKIHVEQKSFSDAMAVCESEGAKLFIIEDEREFQYIKQVLMGVAATVGIGPLIGLRAIGAGREWTWWNGQNLTYLAWIIGQPDNFLNNEACVQLNSYHGFKYNDVSCAYALSYICQRYL